MEQGADRYWFIPRQRIALARLKHDLNFSVAPVGSNPAIARTSILIFLVAWVVEEFDLADLDANLVVATMVNEALT
jgi:hypothetical protein